MIRFLVSFVKKHLVFLLFDLLISLLFFSCTSFPVPRERGDSLFVLVSEINVRSKTKATGWSDNLYFSGPTPFVIKIKEGKWDLHFKRIKPGKYWITKREIVWASGRVERIGAQHLGYLNIKPDSIFLFPFVVVGWYKGNTYIPYPLRSVTPQDQYRISKELPQYFGFSEWIGKRFQGFGRYRPNFTLEKARYDVKIVSSPEEAQVFVDGVSWGKTPIVTQLRPGKHQLLIKKKGFFDYRTFIDVTSDTEITTKLVTVTESNKKQKREIKLNQFSVLIEPFVNVGNKKFDYLVPVFSDVLRVDMLQDRRLFVESLSPKTSASSELPAFKIAYKKGFDLLVHGQYYATANKIFVHATLYDVKTERVKTSLVYSGEAGLGIFDSVDEMGREFLKAVSRVLPPEGKRIIEEKREITQKVVTLERKITKEQVIEKRRKQNWAYSVCGAAASHLDYVTVANDVYMVANGPQFGVLGSYELKLFGPLDMVLKFQPTFTFFPGAPPDTENGMDFPVWMGPQLDFLGYRTTLYTSLLGLFRYATVRRYSYNGDEMGGTFEIGPYFYTGLVVDTGLKYYTYRRFDERASFFTMGFMLGLIEYRFEDGFQNARPVNVDIGMYVGYGSRM